MKSQGLTLQVVELVDAVHEGCIAVLPLSVHQFSNIIGQSIVPQKCRSSLDFAGIQKCYKRRCPYHHNQPKLQLSWAELALFSQCVHKLLLLVHKLLLLVHKLLLLVHKLLLLVG